MSKIPVITDKARAAIGVSALPMGAQIEIDAVMCLG